MLGHDIPIASLPHRVSPWRHSRCSARPGGDPQANRAQEGYQGGLPRDQPSDPLGSVPLGPQRLLRRFLTARHRSRRSRSSLSSAVSARRLPGDSGHGSRPPGPSSSTGLRTDHFGIAGAAASSSVFRSLALVVPYQKDSTIMATASINPRMRPMIMSCRPTG